MGKPVREFATIPETKVCEGIDKIHHLQRSRSVALLKLKENRAFRTYTVKVFCQPPSNCSVTIIKFKIFEYIDARHVAIPTTVYCIFSVAFFGKHHKYLFPIAQKELCNSSLGDSPCSFLLSLVYSLIYEFLCKN